MPRLTNKQAAFINAYLANGFNATKAAITAKYSAKTAAAMGSENLRKPYIAELIRARLHEMAMPAEEALARLADIARGDMDDFVTPGGWIDLEGARDAGKLHLVKRVTRTVTTRGELTRDTVTVELYDKQAALVQILNEGRLKDGRPTSRIKVETSVHAEPSPDLRAEIDRLSEIAGILAAVERDTAGAGDAPLDAAYDEVHPEPSDGETGGVPPA